MKDGITVTGIVLGTMPIGEYDRRISLLTREQGKITVFAKGARRPNSAFVACTQTFTFGEFRVFPGKSAFNLMSAEVKNYFSELRNDFSWVYRGMYLCEFAEYIAQEGNDETEVLKLLYQSLRALSNPKLPAKLVRAVYDLRMIIIGGEGPQVYECVKCGKESLSGTNSSDDKNQVEQYLFSINLGGLLCEECEQSRRDTEQRLSDVMILRKGTVTALKFICTTPVERLYTFTLAEENLDELSELADRYRRRYVGHEMKSGELWVND